MVDPRGVEPRDVEAATSATYLGRPTVTSFGQCALGSFGRCEAASVHRGHDAAMVADARLYAWLERPPPALAVVGLAQAEPALDAVLRQAGVNGLSLLAGDFALARWEPDHGRLTLARDPFGVRPLFWAQRGERFAFASDPEVLIRLGVAGGQLDPLTIAAFLCELSNAGERTAFAGVSRLVGGHALVVEHDRRRSLKRWFSPETAPEDPDMSPDEQALVVRKAVSSALADRLGSRRGLLSLSGGRDSGALAVAAADLGLPLDCVTFTFEDVLDSPSHQLQLDALAARDLARQLGLHWRGLRVPGRTSDDELRRLPGIARTPVVGLHFSLLLAFQDAIVNAGDCVVIDGEGGDTLFSANQIVVLDLVRRGALGRARRAVRGFSSEEHRRYRQLARAVLRGMAPWPTPARVQRWRARRVLPRPPWVVGPDVRTLDGAPYLSARQTLIDGILDLGADPLAENTQISARVGGAEYTAPLLDQRVVRAALAGPAVAHAPDPGLKPILRLGILREHDRSRTRGNFFEYYARIARSTVRDCAGYTDGVRAAEEGLIRPDRLDMIADSRWSFHSTLLVELEAWLRYGYGGEK